MKLNIRLPDKSVESQIVFSFFLNQNIFCGYSEHPKHTIKLMDKKIIAILRSNISLVWIFRNESKLEPLHRTRPCTYLRTKVVSNIK